MYLFDIAFYIGAACVLFIQERGWTANQAIRRARGRLKVSYRAQAEAVPAKSKRRHR